MIDGGLTMIDVRDLLATVVVTATGAMPDAVTVMVVEPAPTLVIRPLESTVDTVVSVSACVLPLLESCAGLGFTVKPTTVRAGVIEEQLAPEKPPAARTILPER